MFSFFKRLVGKTSDTPDENQAEDAVDLDSEFEAGEDHARYTGAAGGER
jgi:fused signal recognition particle receptor